MTGSSSNAPIATRPNIHVVGLNVSLGDIWMEAAFPPTAYQSYVAIASDWGLLGSAYMRRWELND